jgi:hypothetical protein
MVLNARIDLEKGLLVSNQIDLRAEVQRTTLESLREFNAYQLLHKRRGNVRGTCFAANDSGGKYLRHGVECDNRFLLQLQVPAMP